MPALGTLLLVTTLFQGPRTQQNTVWVLGQALVWPLAERPLAAGQH